jgi:hypothetical protein
MGTLAVPSYYLPMSVMRLLGVLAACGVASSSTAAPGDILQRAVLDCAQSKGLAEIRVEEVVQQGYQPPFSLVNIDECELSGVGSLRLKWGVGPVYDYGQGHGTPTMFLSLWVRQVKVLSRRQFACESEACPIRVVVTAKGVDECRSSEPGGSNVNKCESSSWAELRGERDALEFPLPGERKRPADFSTAVAYASDEAFCAKFAQATGSERVGIPFGASKLENLRSGLYEYNGSYDFYDLDMDNDGRNEQVVHLHSSTHAFEGDEIFVFSTKPVPDVPVVKVGDTRSEEKYAAAADKMLPAGWRLVPEKLDAPWWDRADHLSDEPLNDFQYFQPLRFEGRTYFIATSGRSAQIWWGALLEPRPNGTVQMKCAMHRVQPNY